MKNEKEEGVRAAGKEVWVIKFGFADLINDLKSADFNPATPVFISLPDLLLLLPAFCLFPQAWDDQIKKKKKRTNHRSWVNPTFLLRTKALNLSNIDLHLKTDLNTKAAERAFGLNDYIHVLLSCLWIDLFELRSALTGIAHRQVGNARSCNLYCWAFTNTVKEIRVIPLAFWETGVRFTNTKLI